MNPPTTVLVWFSARRADSMSPHDPKTLLTGVRGESGTLRLRRSQGPLARDLPETALRATSRCLTTPVSTLLLTWVFVWVREVMRGLWNPRASMVRMGSPVRFRRGAPPRTAAQAGATPRLSRDQEPATRVCQRVCQTELCVLKTFLAPVGLALKFVHGGQSLDAVCPRLRLGRSRSRRWW